MTEATEIVHWPGQDTPACEEHAQKLKALGRFMGIIVSSTPWPADGTICKELRERSEENADVKIRIC